MKIHELIKKERLKKNIKQQEVANEIHVSINFVSLMERGKSRIPIEKLILIIKLLGIKKSKAINSLVHEYKINLIKEFA